jgi:hypothetical protein
MKDTVPNFRGKFVSVSLAGEDCSHAIDRPRFEVQGGRLFLVGVIPRGGSTGDWSEGAVCAIAWDSVTDYLVFDSAKHYRKALAKFRKHKGKHKA